MGEGERALLRQVGRCRALGDTGEDGDRGGVVDFTGDDASEDMLMAGHSEDTFADMREPQKTTVGCWKQETTNRKPRRKVRVARRLLVLTVNEEIGRAHV